MDTLQKFMFDAAPIRGELVEISEAWRCVQARQDYPHAVKMVLGEMLAAAALLSANLKFNGSLIMQIHGDGPVRLLVVECDSDLQLRATAKLVPDAPIASHMSLPQLVNAHGQGRFVVTLDPHDKLPGQHPYQGIVPLDGDSVATVIENYMQSSEQLETRLWLAADDQVTRGLLLQKLPQQENPEVHDEVQKDAWNRMVILGSTLQANELLTTDIQTLLHRLFWEESIRLFGAQHPHFHCSCTREKVGNMLRLLGQDEVQSALAELGALGIDCDFCGQHYHFDSVDCAQLFATDTTSSALAPSSHLKH